MFKVKVPTQKGIQAFSGLSHGLKFEQGFSEEFKDEELKDRLLLKGYELVDTKPTKTTVDELKEIAKGLGIDIEGMKKPDLEKAIEEATNAKV